MWWDGWGWGMGAWILTTVVTLAFWGALIAGVIIVVKRYGGGPRERGTRAEQILAERFARGEIDESTYRRQVAVLRTRD